MENRKEKDKKILTIIVILFVISVSTLLYSKLSDEQTAPKPINNELNNETEKIEDINSTTKNEINTNTATENKKKTNENQDDYIETNGTNYEIDTKNKTDVAYLLDKNAGSAKRTPTPKGKQIAIAITGMDGRLGRPSKHADANQLIIVYPDAGKIEIISIPRDTYVDIGYTDSTHLNKLTYCRANKGREAYLKEVAQIANISKVNYWVEFSFSQAMGIIEFLGYKNPANTLQVLRSRKGLGGDDYQRCYNQGQFIRQSILSHFDKFTGITGGLLIRAGLLFVETNLTADAIINMVDNLEKNGFPKPELVNVKIRPNVKMDYKVYDFNDTTISKLTKKIESFNKPRFENEIESAQPKVNVANRLNSVIKEAIADSAKRPATVISKLSPYFQQRAWMQVNNKNERIKIRNDFQILLVNAYRKRNNPEEAEKVNAIIEAEKELFGE